MTSVEDFTFGELQNDHIRVVFCNYGAMIYDLQTKDHLNQWQSIVLQYESLADYIDNALYCNAVVGPVAGRIQGARYTLNGKPMVMQANHLQTESLHSGDESLARQLWAMQVLDNKVIMQYEKLKSESQFPGHQTYEVHYSLINDELIVDFYALTNHDTLVNLTQHAYFNLSGNLTQDILTHELFVASSRSLTLNSKFSPIGVEELPDYLNFLQLTPVGQRLTKELDQSPTKGIDHPVLLDLEHLDQPQVVCYDPESQRCLSIQTTYPCVVIYTHNHSDKKPLRYQPHHLPRQGICFETQFEPNGINVEGLNDSILRANQPYHHQTRYRFTLGRPSQM
jgi:aldose 1-epimerase